MRKAETGITRFEQPTSGSVKQLLAKSVMRSLLAVILFAAVSAAANPFRPIYTYIASEQLSIGITKSEATFVGDFVFRHGEIKQPELSRVVFYIPIWFPEENAQDKTVAEFWETFQKDSYPVIPDHYVSFMRPEVAAEKRKVLKHAIDLRVRIGKKEVPVKGFAIYSADTKRAGIPQVWKEPGYCCLMFHFSVEPRLINDTTHVTISYRQPYLRKDGETRLFYVPIFQNLPNDISTTDTNHYCIRVTTSKDCSIVVTNGEQRLESQAGQSVNFAPTHHQAIRVTATQVEPNIDDSEGKGL